VKFNLNLFNVAFELRVLYIADDVYAPLWTGKEAFVASVKVWWD
jgi:hypothetical protein